MWSSVWGKIWESINVRSMLCQFFSCLRFVVLILYSSTVWFERDGPCNCVQNGFFLLLHGFCDNIETVSLCSSVCRTQKEWEIWIEPGLLVTFCYINLLGFWTKLISWAQYHLLFCLKYWLPILRSAKLFVHILDTHPWHRFAHDGESYRVHIVYWSPNLTGHYFGTYIAWTTCFLFLSCGFRYTLTVHFTVLLWKPLSHFTVLLWKPLSHFCFLFPSWGFRHALTVLFTVLLWKPSSYFHNLDRKIMDAQWRWVINCLPIWADVKQ